MIEIPLTRDLTALVDDSDAEVVNQFKWHAFTSCGIHYARRRIGLPNRRSRTQLLHQFLTGWDLVDHRNGEGLDNRRCNLRLATPSQNMANQRKTHGQSRYKGVSRSKGGVRWRAQIEVLGQSKHLGIFADQVAAALAYDAAARVAFGEFAALNFPEPGERSALR